MYVDIRFGAPNCQNKAEVYTNVALFRPNLLGLLSVSNIAGYRIKCMENPCTPIGWSPKDSKMLAIRKLPTPFYFSLSLIRFLN